MEMDVKEHPLRSKIESRDELSEFNKLVTAEDFRGTEERERVCKVLAI